MIQITFPFIMTWAVSAAAAATGLTLAYGFREPLVTDPTIRILLLISLGTFVLSRLLLFVPLRSAPARLQRWWVDLVLIVAAAAWWATSPARETVILRIGAIYVLVMATGAIARSATTALLSGWPRSVAPIPRLLLWAVGSAVIGGAVLALPVCWSKPYTGEKTSQHAKHILDCAFTATSALTGTGLSPLDIGNDFSRTGQVVILILMQLGGLAMLVAATVAAWRFRRAIGWGAINDDISPAGTARLIRFICIFVLLAEVAGGAALYRIWDPAVDANFSREPARLVLGSIDESRLLWSAFHAVSGFCNVGFVLPRDGLIAYADRWGMYASLLPLMILGGLGGTVLYDVWRAVGFSPRGGASGRGSGSLAYESRVTLVMTGLLIVVGAALLMFTETSRRWQLRYPREDTPGRLNLSSKPAETEIVFSAESSERARAERMQNMPRNQRVWSAVFHSVSARTTGVPAARLDESSLAPAGRAVLMSQMLIGGGLGGAAGGLRIVVVWLLIGSVLIGSGRAGSAMVFKGIVAAAAIAAAMAILIGATALILIYREAGSFEACTFEAISACCNVGFSTGLTPQLSIEGRCAIILAMLLGRILPLGILLRSSQD